MLDRSPLGWLRERDIDLLFCCELHFDGPLRRWLAERLDASNVPFRGAWVSHAELEGESDLVVAWKDESGVILALIENKIAAAFQPDQAGRYSKRAARWRSEPGIARVVTMLLAPEEYLSRPGAGGFDLKLSYETVSDVLQGALDPRSLFLEQALNAGIEAYRRGYVPEINDQVTAIWDACWQVAEQVAPKLRFRRPGEKPGRSSLIYFREADGCERSRNAVVVYKAERGQADLQFKGISPSTLSKAVDGLLQDGMNVVKAGQSSSIRISVPLVDFRADSSTQLDRIEHGLLACERLRAFFTQHRTSILAGVPTDR